MSWPQNPDWASILPKLPVAASPPNVDTNNLDNDPNTDSYLLGAWIPVDLLVSWPGSVPINLMTLTFEFKDGATGTTPLNIRATSNAEGYTFYGHNHTVDISGTSNVTTPTIGTLEQHVYVLSSVKSPKGTKEIVTLRYDSDDPTTTGIGLSIHYDDTKMALTEVSNVFQAGVVVEPEVQQSNQVNLREQLKGRVYRMMTPDEITLFDYVENGYIQDNPNLTTRDSYVGNYQFNPDGN